MAKQTIDIGSSANDGTGDPLRTGGDKANDNFTELYNVAGWAQYASAETSPVKQTFNSTPSKLQVDGGGSLSNSSYLPYEIRGSGELWDTTNDLITPIGIGDSYDIRVRVTIDAETGSPSELKFELDIGGGTSPSTIIATKYEKTAKTTPYEVTVSFLVFSLSKFVTDGGQIFISTDSGSVSVTARSVLIVRTSSGQI